ncbi:MAG: hypothetical protein ACLS3D_08070 [Roseburia hominis]
MVSTRKVSLRRYMSYPPHIEALTQMAMLLLTTTKKQQWSLVREHVAAGRGDGVTCRKHQLLCQCPGGAYDIIMSSETWIGQTWSAEIVVTVLTTAIRLPIMR